MKSLKPKKAGGGDEPPASGGRNEEVDFHGEKRSNRTHASTTDPDAMLYRKGSGMEARLCFIGHALMENRNGLFVDAIAPDLACETGSGIIRPAISSNVRRRIGNGP